MSAENPRRPLVITSDLELREELERLCAAAGLAPDVVSSPGEGRSRWVQAACVVIGDDVAAGTQIAELRDRPGVILVTGSASVRSWQRAVALRAEAVVELPGQRSQLASILADAAEVGTELGCVVGVIGARGGVGASTFAAKLGLVSARLGHAPVLVDVDPGSGGLDILLGCESVPGLRWPDVSAVNGRVSAVALRSALPESLGLAVLSWSPGEPAGLPPGGVGAIVGATKRGSRLVLLDLPRQADAVAAELIGELDTVLLVSGCDIRSATAATRMVEQLRPQCSDMRLIIGGDGVDGIDARDIGAAIGLRVESITRHTRRSQRSINDGLGPVVARRERRGLERLVARLVEPLR